MMLSTNFFKFKDVIEDNVSNTIGRYCGTTQIENDKLYFKSTQRGQIKLYKGDIKCYLLKRIFF